MEKNSFCLELVAAVSIFQHFIHSWVCYDLVKVLHVFDLQPKVRLDIADWSPNLHNTFSYFTVKKLPEYKSNAMRVLNILFNKTEHNSYFVKNLFGSKKNFSGQKSYVISGCINMVTPTTTMLL